MRMDANFHQILFLCTGNYYRSRFAELLFNHSARQSGLCWKAESRGLRLNPQNPGAISKHVVSYLQRHEIQHLSEHRYPLGVTAKDLEKSQRIVAVKRVEHLPLLEQFFPMWVDRVEYWKIHDLDCAGPEEALAQLKQEVLTLIEQLNR